MNHVHVTASPRIRGALAALLSLLVVAWTSTMAHADMNRDALFDALKSAGSEQEAKRIEALIWEDWLAAAPSAEIRDQVDMAMKRRGVHDYQGAKDILDKVVANAPDFSEGWNQRAFVLFLQGQFDESLADIDRVLEIEPRHFGALAGRALIFLNQGRVKLGQNALRDALAVHPYLPERNMLIKTPGRDI